MSKRLRSLLATIIAGTVLLPVGLLVVVLHIVSDFGMEKISEAIDALSQWIEE